MKPLTKISILVAVLVLAVGGTAFADDLQLSVDSGLAGITVSSTTGAVDVVNQTVGGWDISVVAGNSNSPSLTPYGLDITSLTAECTTGTCGALEISLTDVGFITSGLTTLVANFSATDTGSSASATQTVSFLDPTTGATGAIGAPITLTGSGALSGSSSSAIDLTDPFSLTLDETFAGCSGSGCATYSADGDIVSAPEPSSFGMLVLGLGLIGFALPMGRKLVQI